MDYRIDLYDTIYCQSVWVLCFPYTSWLTEPHSAWSPQLAWKCLPLILNILAFQQCNKTLFSLTFTMLHYLILKVNKDLNQATTFLLFMCVIHTKPRGHLEEEKSSACFMFVKPFHLSSKPIVFLLKVNQNFYGLQLKCLSKRHMAVIHYYGLH